MGSLGLIASHCTRRGEWKPNIGKKYIRKFPTGQLSNIAISRSARRALNFEADTVLGVKTLSRNKATAYIAKWIE